MRRTAQRSWEGLETLESRSLLSAVAWDGGGDGSSWEDPLNWSADMVPGPADDVTISVSGLATITHTSNTVESIHSLTCDEQLTLSGGTLFVASDWQQNGPLSLLGTRVIGAGNLIISGDAHWLAGRMDGPGFIQVASGGSLSIDNSVTIARQIFNGGALSWTGGSLSMLGFPITNLAGQTFSISSSGSITGLPGSEIDSAGTIDLGASPQIGVPLTFTSANSLLYQHGGAVTLSSPTTLAQLGNVEVDAPSILTLSGRFKLLAGSTMTGNGSITLGGGSFTLAGTVAATGNLTINQNAVANFMSDSSVTHLVLSNGTLVGAGNLAVTQFDWGPGMVSMGGQISATTISGIGAPASVRQLRSAIDVAGSAAFSSGTFTMYGGSISGAGDVSITGTFNWLSGAITGSGRLILSGTLAGSGTILLQRNLVIQNQLSTVGIDEIDLINTTIVTHSTFAYGHLLLGAAESLHIGGIGSFTNSAASSIHGVLSMGSGVSFHNPGSMFVSGRVVMPAVSEGDLVNGDLTGGGWMAAGTGRIQIIGGAVRTNHTNIVISGRNAGLGALATLEHNLGSISLFSGATLNVTPASGTLVNDGTLIVGTILAVNGNFVQTSQGTYRTTVALPGVLWITGSATLAGSILLDTQSGSTPSADFWFIRAASITGTFQTDASYIHSGGMTAHFQYLPQFVRLIFA